MNLLLLLLVCVELNAFPVTRRLIDEAVDEDLDVLDSSVDHAVPDTEDDMQDVTVVNFLDNDIRERHRGSRHRKRKLHWTREMLLYLHRYGYMDGIEDYNRDIVRSRIAAFQQLAGVSSTGAIDRSTIRAIREPRCGNADLSIKDLLKIKPKISVRRKRFVQISKWRNKVDQSDTLNLEWYIQKYTNDIPKIDIRTVVKQAFSIWEQQTQIPALRTVKLSFSEAENNHKADISIMWDVGDHGDAYPFDGNGKGKKTNILAHTFYPNYRETGTLNGDIHLDDDEDWVLDNSNPNSKTKRVHFPYVLVHEIGHALGLGHSKRQEAVMNPIYKKSSLESIELDIDDQCAINWNYVGPSSTCLYVWLLVELMPRAAESNSSKHVIASVYSTNVENDGPIESNRIWNDEDSFQQRLNMTLQTLADANIPQCSSRNDVQQQYETLLQSNLAFSKNDARKYGPVVCNFLDGFSKFRGKVSRVSSTSDESILRIANVHSYSHGNMEIDTSELDEEIFEWNSARRRRSTIHKLHLHPERDGFIQKSTFNHKFFKKLFRLFVGVSDV